MLIPLGRDRKHALAGSFLRGGMWGPAFAGGDALREWDRVVAWVGDADQVVVQGGRDLGRIRAALAQNQK